MTDQKSVLKRALAAIDDLELRLRQSEAKRREGIAVVGMSCRFPGAASPRELWHLLREGVDAIRPFPAERWSWSGAGAPRPGVAGGFIDGLDQFDPAFFGISPREATTMDPQQRMFLEGAWLALEDAGVRPADLVNTATGVFVGVTTSDYGQLTRTAGQDVYVATGAALNAVSGRVSFVLGLQGPCMSMDTACSSSLVAVHTACQSLRAGDADLALAGGVNALISPEPFELFARWGMLAPDGRCKTFDASADGFSRGEGCGVLVLKRLSDAIADGDRVLAVIRGSAVNQDGRSSGLSVPNGPAQEKALRRALQVAGIAAADVDYVEAHGTGTVLGDPIEVEAIGAVYGKDRPSGRPLRIGSIKTNIGHLESASGVAGLCKVILSLQHETIPAHLHFRQPNPRIAWDDFPIEVPATAVPWPRGERRRIAGVSSFGFTGTNAHILLEEAPAIRAEGVRSAPAYLLPVAARTGEGLRAQSRAYADVLEESTSAFASFCRTAGAERTHFPERIAVVASSARDAAEALRSAAPRTPSPTGEPPRIAFLFSGQGAQRVGMGRELYETSPLARELFDRCAAICEGKLPVPLLDAIFGNDAAMLRRTEVTQPALFALEYVLAQLWQSWGIRPAVVMGHSLGEYVAACVAGALSLEDALTLVIERGRLMGGLPSGGAMAAVFASAAQVERAIDAHHGDVALSAVNGPTNSVISGAAASVSALCSELTAAAIECRPLEVSHAFHSPMMDPILDPLESAARRLTMLPLRIPLATNLHGRVARVGDVLDARYWRRHAREPVRFEACVRGAREAGCDTFLEIGPGSTLLGMARRIVDGNDVRWLASLSSDGEWRTLLHTLGRLYEAGADVDWDALTKPYGGDGMRIPGYAFERRRFWIDAAAESTPAAPAVTPIGAHPLLGVPIEVAADDTRLWSSVIDLDRLPYLGDHRVQGAAIVPATAYIEIAFAAAEAVIGSSPVRVTEIVNEKPLILRKDQRFVVQTRVSLNEEGGWRFEVHSRPHGHEDRRWTRHVRATLHAIEAPAMSTFDIEAARGRCPTRIAGQEFYDRLSVKGNQWGPAFQAMVEVWKGTNEALSRVRAPAGIAGELDQYRFHPAFSDAAGHVLVATGELDRSDAATGGALVGGGVSEIRQYGKAIGTSLWAHATRVMESGTPDNVVVGNVSVYDDTGALISETLGARLWYLRESPASDTDDLFYAIAWDRAGAGKEANAHAMPRSWCLLADERGVATALAKRLGDAGHEVHLVYPDWSASRAGESIDPHNPADWDALLDEVAGDGPLGIVHLWSVGSDADTPPVFGGAAGAASGLPLLVQRLAARGSGARLWLATAGAQPVRSTDTRLRPESALLWGFGRALAVEHRELWGGLVDLDPVASSADSSLALWQCIAGSVAEPVIAYRNGEQFVPRLRRAEAPVATAPQRFDGTCVISGGLGGIGLEVARWLVERGCRHLVLLGRNIPDESNLDGARWSQVRDRLTPLYRAGANVRLEAVDVAHPGQVDAMAARLRREGAPPVRAVFHAAGTLQYGPIAALSTDAFEGVLAAKVVGARNLVAAFGNDLERIVFFSSTSSLLPSPLMAGYSAANAFLDSLAHDLRARDIRATSVNWGTWGEVGMATEFAGRDSGAVLTGLRTLQTEEALSALERVLAADLTQIGILRMDWREWQRLYPDFIRDPLFAEFVTEGATTEAPTLQLDRIGDLDAVGRRLALGDFLAACVGGVLGIQAAELDRRVSINRLGFDSLMALETKNRIESSVGVLIPVVRLLEGPSVNQLADELNDLWDRRIEPASGRVATAVAIEGEI
jgi:acyl transferase domain-containing protein